MANSVYFSLLDWIYPPKCISCGMIFAPVHGEPTQWICENCEPLLEPIPDPVCPICGYPTTEGFDCPSCKNKKMHYDIHRAAFVYDGVLRDLLHDIKFRSKRRTAQGLGAVLAETIINWNINGDLIIPIPLHPSKKRSRGFNQASVLALPFSKSLKIPMADNMIKRVKRTAPQSNLTPIAREQNLQNAFSLNTRKYNPRNKQIILIDDIYTSGATMNACTKILKDHGADKIICISLSLAVSKKSDNFNPHTNTMEVF